MKKDSREISFTFKRFALCDSRCGMKIGTDGVALGSWTSVGDASDAIDVGAGSGLISLMLAQRGVKHVTAIEIDSGAAEDCRLNIAASPWADRVNLYEGDFASYNPPKPVDLIVSNPPFFDTGETAPDAARAGARHEGSLNFSSLIDFASARLKPSGRLSLIAPSERADDIIWLGEMRHLKLRRLCHVSTVATRDPARVMLELSPTDGPICYEHLDIRDTDGRLSDGFRLLTQDFYLK